MSNVFSNIKLFPLKNPTNTLLANGAITIHEIVEIKFTVNKGQYGIYASFPGKKGTKPKEDGKLPWYSDIRLLNKDLYFEFQELVKTEYGKITENKQDKAGEENQTEEYNDGIPF